MALVPCWDKVALFGAHFLFTVSTGCFSVVSMLSIKFVTPFPNFRNYFCNLKIFVTFFIWTMYVNVFIILNINESVYFYLDPYY